jgi:hypothetical protein
MRAIRRRISAASRVEARKVAATPRPQRLDLVVHQGDQGRDHQRRPPEEAARELIDEALALAGRHDQEEAAVGQQRLDRLALTRAELRVAEPPEALLEIDHALRAPPVSGGLLASELA